MSLFADFLTHKERGAFKWSHYFPVYERHFSAWKNRSLFFLEIGVSEGGSLQMWQQFFGPYAKIVGIDIKPECKDYEQDGIFVRTGDQGDSKFLQQIIDEFGVPDIVLDDGSHAMWHVNATFDFLYPKMGKNSIYMVEDMHTAYWERWGGGKDKPESFVNRCKGFIDELNAELSRGDVEETEFSRTTMGMSFYDSIVVLEKGDVYWKKQIRTGCEEA